MGPSLSVVSQFQLLSQKIKTKSNNKKKHSERKDKIRKPLLRDVNCDKSRPYSSTFVLPVFHICFSLVFTTAIAFKLTSSCLVWVVPIPANILSCCNKILFLLKK